MAIATRNQTEADFVYEEVFERQEYFQHGIDLPNDAIVFDVGAHIGMFSLAVSQQAPNATIYAFEPMPELAEVLQANMTLYDVNAHVFDCGLAAHTGNAEFTYYPDLSILSGRYGSPDEERAVVEAFIRGDHTNTPTNTATDTVTDEEWNNTLTELVTDRLQNQQLTRPLRTLSDIIDQHPIPRIDLLKIDAEKSELEILHGIQPQHWPLIQQIVLEVHDINNRPHTITNLLTHHGFHTTTQTSPALNNTGLHTLYATRTPTPQTPTTPETTPTGSTQPATPLPPAKSATPTGTTKPIGSTEPVGLMTPINVAARWCDADLLTTDITTHIEQHLPPHMIPTTLITLPHLPLTPNGKIDRTALPTPHTPTPTNHRQPQTPNEHTLHQLFTHILNLPTISIDDSFFTLGGDSIMSIQLVTRARTAGLILTPHDVFQHKTIAALATHARTPTTTPTTTPDNPTGTFPPTPIIAWLQEQQAPINQFSQSMIIHTPTDATPQKLTATLQTILDHHHTLRMRINTTPTGQWQPEITPTGTIQATNLLTHTNTNHLTPTQLTHHITTHTTAAQQRLNPTNGTMTQAVWFNPGPHQQGLLLLVLHHLVTDGVSWRLLLNDLATAYHHINTGQTPQLPPTGTSYRTWAHTHTQQATTPTRTAETPLWTNILNTPDPPLTTTPLNPQHHTHATTATHTTTLPPHHTTPLLTTIPTTYNATIEDILLTAFTTTLTHWRQQHTPHQHTTLLIDLENHGRHPLTPTTDPTRTIGWYTNKHPTQLDPGPITWHNNQPNPTHLHNAIKRIKEQQRTLPDHGIGYGQLRYLNPHTNLPHTTPQIAFNYLGRYTTPTTPTPWNPPPNHPTLNSTTNPNTPTPHLITLNALTHQTPNGPQLTTTWNYQPTLTPHHHIHTLNTLWTNTLTTLTTHHTHTHTTHHTPSDL
ncbi:FkbM family methyltransferase, partial [Streptomyces sp. NPDC017979]|uniref:FkbM family methyltransferase n=1 Tax=Streptomyces sp. NPDC017979 TaxID=3365024 RepID=UPI003798A4F1